MPYRLPTSQPQSLHELWERFREYVRQTEPVVLENVMVGTTETVVPHGLGEIPIWVAYDSPHCVAIVKQTRHADTKRLYLKATNRCVVNVRLLRAGPLLPGQMPNGGYHLQDWIVGSSAQVSLLPSSLVLADSGGNNGKFFLGQSNRYLVNPSSLNLTQIEIPDVTSETTAEITMIFTAPILFVPNVTPDSGFAALRLAQDAAITGIELANPYSSMKFIYISGISAWLRLEEAEL